MPNRKSLERNEARVYVVVRISVKEAILIKSIWHRLALGGATGNDRRLKSRANSLAPPPSLFAVFVLVIRERTKFIPRFIPGFKRLYVRMLSRLGNSLSFVEQNARLM